MSKDEVLLRPIYMDHNATTPVDALVLEAMLPYFTDVFGNAASIDHLYGSDAALAVETARKQIGQLLHCEADEIIFTSGATESNNLAIIGAAERLEAKGKHIITCVTEHHSVLDVCQHLEARGWQVTYLPVDQYGLIDRDDVRRAITPQTTLISIMTANNEIGTLAPISDIGKIAHEANVLFHTDATQSIGYLPADVDEFNVDLLSMSAHKMYGPKGVGVLYIRKRNRRVKLAQQIHGGGHERGMRSGTLNVPGIVGMGKAAEIVQKEQKAQSQRLLMLREGLWSGLQEHIPDIQMNGHPVQRLPHNLSVSIPGIESRLLIVQLNRYIAISSGSACTTSRVEPSHVILALGYGVERAHQSLRFGLGKNSMDEVNTVIRHISQEILRLKKYILW